VDIIISLKCNVFSPWYSWKIADLALNNTHSVEQQKLQTKKSKYLKNHPINIATKFGS